MKVVMSVLIECIVVLLVMYLALNIILLLLKGAVWEIKD